MVTEKYDVVAFLARNIGNVYHADIHAYVSDVWGFLTIDQGIGITVTEKTVPSVGITDGDGGNARIPGQFPATAVAYCFTGPDVMNLQDCCLERGYIIYNRVVPGINAVQAQTQAYHVHLTVWEMFDSCAVVHVPQDVVWECCLQRICSYQVAAVLFGRELVERVAVAAYKVGKYAAWNKCCLMLQLLYEPWHLGLGVEAEPVHSGIELDVNGHACYACTLGCVDKCVKYAERIDFGLQIVLEECIETGHLGVHYHNGLGNAVAAQQCAFVGNGNCQIAYLCLALQGLGDLDCSCSVCIGLDHTDNFGIGIQERAVVVQVVDYCTKIDFQYCLVYLLLQCLGDFLEMEAACSLDKYHAVT